jgi:uncharacterized phage infection (PIP) family protein YhgE
MEFYTASCWHPETAKAINHSEKKEKKREIAVRFQHDIDEMLTKIKELNQNNTDLKHNVSRLESMLSEMDGEWKKTRLASQKHEERAKELESHKRILEKRCTELSGWAEQHRLDKLHQKESLDAATESLLHMSNQLDSARSEHTKLSQKLTAAREDHRSAVSEKESVTSMLQDMDDACSAITKAHKALQEKYTNAKADHTRLSGELATANESHRKALEEKEHISSMLEDMDRMCSSTLKAHTTLNAQHRAAEAGRTRALSQVERLTAEIDQLQTSRDNWKIIKQELEHQLEQNTSTLDSHMSLLNSAPVNVGLTRRAASIIQSSAEILSLARPNDPALAHCLSEVGSSLNCLHEELDQHLSLSREWSDNRDNLCI